jgi:hypothetical protein
VLLGWSRREFYGAHCNANFVRELSNIGFAFTPLKDLGYYGLNPELPYKPLSSVDREDILQYLNVHGKPNQLRPVLAQKVEFENPNQTAWENRWPFGQMEIAGLHVAALVSFVSASDMCMKSLEFTYSSFLVSRNIIAWARDSNCGLLLWRLHPRNARNTQHTKSQLHCHAYSRDKLHYYCQPKAIFKEFGTTRISI